MEGPDSTLAGEVVHRSPQRELSDVCLMCVRCTGRPCSEASRDGKSSWIEDHSQEKGAVQN